jgi:hypothetical protein
MPTKFTQAEKTEILERRLSELAQYVSDELAKVDGLAYTEANARALAKSLTSHALSQGRAEESLLQRLKTTKISERIQALATFLAPYDIALQSTFRFLETHTTLLQVTPEPLQKKIKLVSKLYCDGDLKPPTEMRKDPVKDERDAVQLIVRTGYNILTFGDAQIYATALLLRLDDKLELHEAFNIKDAERRRRIASQLKNKNSGKCISDGEWNAIQHLADGAGIPRPSPEKTPNRIAFEEALRRRTIQKKPEEPGGAQ